MNLKELHSFKLSDAVTFHNELNPKLWNKNLLRPEVKKQLKIIADDFLQELGISGLDVKDITISGSNAAYSYTQHSDLDLHILVDMSDMPDNDVYRELFNAKKTIYNDMHDIKIHGIPVELYVQDSSQPVISLGEYSVMNDDWKRIPTKRRSDFDQTATKSKYEKLLSLIEIALKSRKYSKVKHIIDTIKRYRQAGLDKGGEFGPENLAYKMLRSQGYITKLYELRDKLHSEKLSFETMYQNIDENEETNHWYDAGVKDATRGARPNPRTYLPTLKDKQAKHPEEVYFYMNGYKSVKQGVEEGFPQPGPSSGAPKQFGPDAKIQTRQMTVKDIISSVSGVPYYNNVVDDWDTKDYSWGVTKKVIEYATYLKDHPESLAKLPPAIVLNGKFEDGAHRVSAIWLLQQRMDPTNPLWKNAKLNVQFVKQGVAEGLQSHDFMAGHCHVMALALKQLHPDWQIRAHIGYDDDEADDTEYRVDHVYTVAPDGTAYDCRGKFSNEEQLVGPDTTGGVDTQYVDFGPEEIKQAMLRGELKRFSKQDLDNAMQVGKQVVAEGEINDTAISLSKLGKFHSGADALAEFVPERASAQYALHPDKWESTFYSLTNKDSDKLRYYGPKKISIPPGTLVGDMAIANKFYRAKTSEEKQQYAKAYKASLQSYPVDVSQYRMPELLIPRQNVDEAFDQPYPLKWETSDYGDVDALARLPDGSPLSIMFNQQQDNDGEAITQVEFYRNNSQEVTGEGDAQRIFATVLTAIQKYIKKYKPLRLTFSASKDNWAKQQQNSESRASLYDRLVQRYARSWGYRAFRADNGDLVIYELSRIQKQKAVGEDYTMQFASEKTPPVSPYAGVKDNQYRGGISEAADKKISFKVQKGKGKFSTTLTVNNSPAGIYQYDSNTGRSIAEVYPEFKGKGLGKLLVLHAIYTAAQLGLDFQEDESRTAAYDNVLDSLSSNGYIVDDDGYWYVTGEGEQYLKQSLNEASGYIPSEKQKNDPRFKTALTVDVHPGSIKKNAKAFYWNTSRAGIPPTAKANGKIY